MLSHALMAVVQSTDTINNIAYVLGAALAAALGGGAVAWRRLTVLGRAERDKLVAEKQNIIDTAEDRATRRSLEALQIALQSTERERDYLRTQLERARDEIASLQSRLAVVETRMGSRIPPSSPPF